MVYLVTNQLELFDSNFYSCIDVSTALNLIKDWNIIQFDTETKGVDARIVPILCAQLGNKKAGVQIVIDCTTIDIKLFKSKLESTLIVGQNLYFDLQFLYSYDIKCKNIYDTMIVEQLLYLGYPAYKKDSYKSGPSMSLAAIAERRLGIHIDKSVRGQIIWRGLDTNVILYAAKDVEYLEDIMWSQVNECKQKNCLIAARVECNFVPVLAYGSWCGIKLDDKTWEYKMTLDREKLYDAVNKLKQFVIKQNNPKFIKIELQGSLFDGFDNTPKCAFEWGIPGIKIKKLPIIEFIKSLGFDISNLNKNNNKDSIDLKALKKQKGINDEFLELYIKYSEAYKLVTTYGITYINAINPNTGRIHTSFKQLAADTGRIACGNSEEDESVKINPDLAKLKGFPIKTDDVTKKCGYPNIQTLPSDKLTRKSFIAEEGNLFCSCDWSAIESRLGADIYQEKSMINEFIHGSGDMHSLVAKMIFPELKEVPIKDIKKLYPHLRNKAKPVEFSQQFGGSPFAIQNAMGCSIEEARKYSVAYNEGFKGIVKFKNKGSKFVRSHGYILLNPITGHKTYWWDWKDWCAIQKSFTSKFWEDYNLNHKGTGDSIAEKVSKHFKTASKWDRKALNSVTQGTGAICLKVAARKFYDWIIDNGYFNIVKIVNFVHDEICIEYPEYIPETSNILKNIMEETTAIFCKSLPIPAEASVGKYWIH